MHSFFEPLTQNHGLARGRRGYDDVGVGDRLAGAIGQADFHSLIDQFLPQGLGPHPIDIVDFDLRHGKHHFERRDLGTGLHARAEKTDRSCIWTGEILRCHRARRTGTHSRHVPPRQQARESTASRVEKQHGKISLTPLPFTRNTRQRLEPEPA